MNAKDIFVKMKEDNLKNEINLAKKINDGNENLKKTLFKIKKNMEKVFLYSNVNYDCFSEKLNDKSNNNYQKTSLDKNYDNILSDKKINKRNDYYNDYYSNENKGEIQIIDEPITIFDINQDDISKINDEKEVLYLKNELMNTNKNTNKNNIKNINKKENKGIKKDIKAKKNENKIEIKNSNLSHNSYNRNNIDKNKNNSRTILISNSLNIDESTLNKTNKSNSKQTQNKQTNKIQNQKKLNQKTIKLKTTFQNQNIYKSPSLLLKTRISKNNRNSNNNNITNSTTLQSNSKKKINNSKTINYDNDINEQCKKTVSIDSNKKYYDIDSQNKIVSKYNTRRSDNNFLTNIYDKDYNNYYGYNFNNYNKNQFLKNNSIGRNFKNHNLKNVYKSENINLHNHKKFAENIINSIDSYENYNNINNTYNYNNDINNYENQNKYYNYNKNYDYYHYNYNNHNDNNNYNLPYNEGIRKISSSQGEIIRNHHYNNKFDIDERSDENKESNENSNLYNNKIEKHKKFKSEDLYNKSNNSIIHSRLNDIQKKYIELKSKIDILKKEKDYIKKEMNNENISKIKITKFKSETNLIKKKRNKKPNSINFNETKYKLNDIYDDYKEKEEKIIKEISKIKDYPEINSKDDKIGVFIDEIIKNGYNKYKNKKCSNCDSLLSKRIYTKKCPNRKHIFQNLE